MKAHHAESQDEKKGVQNMESINIPFCELEDTSMNDYLKMNKDMCH
jgi:hypothetical protein